MTSDGNGNKLVFIVTELRIIYHSGIEPLQSIPLSWLPIKESILYDNKNL